MALAPDQVWRRWCELWNQGDLDAAIAETVHPGVEWIPISVEGTHFHGHEGVRQWAEQHFRFWETFELHIDEPVSAGPDRLLVLGYWVARGRGSGLGFERQPCAWLLDFRDGTIVRLETFTDRDTGREAAGL